MCIRDSYYLVGSSLPLPLSFWQGIQYSSASTCHETRSRLAALGEVHTLPTLGDVDEGADLWELRDALREQISSSSGDAVEDHAKGIYVQLASMAETQIDAQLLAHLERELSHLFLSR